MRLLGKVIPSPFLRDQIQPGDRIAINKMLGQGSPNIAIKAIGEVKEIDEDDKRVYISWFVKGMSREVPSRGAYASIRSQKMMIGLKKFFIFGNKPKWHNQQFQRIGYADH
jgi:hypothetical protein